MYGEIASVGEEIQARVQENRNGYMKRLEFVDDVKTV